MLSKNVYAQMGVGAVLACVVYAWMIKIGLPVRIGFLAPAAAMTLVIGSVVVLFLAALFLRNPESLGRGIWWSFAAVAMVVLGAIVASWAV